MAETATRGSEQDPANVATPQVENLISNTINIALEEAASPKNFIEEDTRSFNDESVISHSQDVLRGGPNARERSNMSKSDGFHLGSGKFPNVRNHPNVRRPRSSFKISRRDGARELMTRADDVETIGLIDRFCHAKGDSMKAYKKLGPGLFKQPEGTKNDPNRLGPSGWQLNHHISVSMCNGGLSSSYRNYFDRPRTFMPQRDQLALSASARVFAQATDQISTATGWHTKSNINFRVRGARNIATWKSGAGVMLSEQNVKQKTDPFLKKLEGDWDSRHHASVSSRNHMVAQNNRNYFDRHIEDNDKLGAERPPMIPTWRLDFAVGGRLFIPKPVPRADPFAPFRF